MARRSPRPVGLRAGSSQTQRLLAAKCLLLLQDKAFLDSGKQDIQHDGTMVCWWCCPEIEQSLGGELAHNTDPLCSVDTQLPLEEPHIPFHHLLACINKHIYCHWHFLASSPKQLPSMVRHGLAGIARDQKSQSPHFSVFIHGFTDKSHLARLSWFAPTLPQPVGMQLSLGTRAFQHKSTQDPTSPPGRKTWLMVRVPLGASFTKNKV